MSAKLISVIGPPAVGKTTLAELLAEELPAELVREDYAGNPFLAESYAGSPEARLPAQLHYLMGRVTQLAASTWPQAGVMVSDYGFCQDRIFAEARLGPDDLRLYDRVARRVSGLVHAPEMIVHLDASEATLLQRIADRARAFERAINTEFLAAMRAAYNAPAAAEACAIIRVDCDRQDVRSAAVRAALLADIREKL